MVSTGVELEGTWVSGMLDELEAPGVEIGVVTGVLDEVEDSGVELEDTWVPGILDKLEDTGVVLEAVTGMLDEVEDTGVLDEVDGTSVLGLTEDTAVLDTIGVTEVLDGIQMLGGVSVALDLTEVSVPQTVSVTTMVRTSGWSE